MADTPSPVPMVGLEIGIGMTKNRFSPRSLEAASYCSDTFSMVSSASSATPPGPQ
jgi:hypothetical protein